MKRVLAYSHDTYGLGNIRRMLAVCNHLIDGVPDLSILMLSGSPMVHSFRVKPGLDYIKLPCLSRTEAEGYAVKTIAANLDETVSLRSDLILRTVESYRPDLILVDKKPYGVEQELCGALEYVENEMPDTSVVLLLRDVLDSAENTMSVWKKHGYHDAIRRFYDLILVVGLRAVFDACKEYRFPSSVAEKVRFCGYIKQPAERRRREAVRKELQMRTQKLVLVTVGGGEDGFELMEVYLAGLTDLAPRQPFDSLLVCGPEMPPSQRARLRHAALRYPHVQVREFVADMLSYMDAADVVVSMAGYNTVCELLSLQKRAVLVPRAKPVAEQWIRAQRMANLGFFRVIHPEALTPENLVGTVLVTLDAIDGKSTAGPQLDLDALPRIARHVTTLLDDSSSKDESAGEVFLESCFA